jgi:hypothetical protein
MESNIDKKEKTEEETQIDENKKENSDLKKLITKVDNRVKTKV